VLIDRAPLAYKSALGGLAGAEIELIRKFTKTRDMRLTLSEYPKEDLFIALRRGDIDIAIPSATEEEIAARFLSPCAAHSETGQRLVANANVAPYITELKQIDNPNVRVYSVTGSTSARFAKKFFQAADVASLESIEQCVKKVLNDNGCLCLTDEVTANILLKKYNEQSSKNSVSTNSSKGSHETSDPKAKQTLSSHKPKIAFVLERLTNEKIAWAVSRTNKTLKKSLNDFFKKLEEGGEAPPSERIEVPLFKIGDSPTLKHSILNPISE
jgi:membrane-bound lytic murein transglycosylase MltF